MLIGQEVFVFQAEDGIRDDLVTGVQTCALPISSSSILSAVRRELSWTHIKTLMYVDDPLKREFYLELCRLERWSSRQLQERMDSMLFERSAISRKSADAIRHDLAQMRQDPRGKTGDAFKEPYGVEFL